jgi:23S rRNA (uracil-5-)-methyltransferase RumA
LKEEFRAFKDSQAKNTMGAQKIEGKSICEHARICNGCPRMCDSYSLQSESKQKIVKKTVHDYIEKIGFEPAEKLTYYRNKLDWWFDSNKQLGFRHKENKRAAISIPNCLLCSPEAQQVYQLLEKRLKNSSLAHYDVILHEGFLRYITIRESKSRQKRIIGIVTFTNEHANEIEDIANQLIETKLVHGVQWIQNPTWSDTSNGTVIKKWGETTLIETINDIDFEYGFQSFFQTNPVMAEKLQKYVTSLIDKKERVLDLYCGTGFFSIPISQKGNTVLGLELAEEAIGFASKNASRNNILNVQFEVANVPKYLNKLRDNHETFDTVILDPPRSGLSKKIWRRVLRLNPKKLIYVSCSPNALKRDLEWLNEYTEFTAESVKAFDLFPNTDHVETVLNIKIERRLQEDGLSK